LQEPGFLAQGYTHRTKTFSAILPLSFQVMHIFQPAGFKTARSDNGDTNICTPQTSSGKKTAELLNKILPLPDASQQ
jgi:hypothetical protein